MTETIMPPEMLANLKVRQSAVCMVSILISNSLRLLRHSWQLSPIPMASTPRAGCLKSARASSLRCAGRGARAWSSRPTRPSHRLRYKPSWRKSPTLTQTHNSRFLHSPNMHPVLTQDSPITVPDYDPAVRSSSMTSFSIDKACLGYPRSRK